MSVILGCIADDVTGGTDLALTLSSTGMRVVQILAEDIGTAPDDVDAVVVALKVRTAPREIAVARVLAAAKQLRGWGVRQLFFKYCSTFDSTDEGNIGPIADALALLVQAEFVPFCPAFPANKRTVYNGHLFVGEQLLSDSPMKTHPLTPMSESDLRILLGRQAPQRMVGLTSVSIVDAGVSAIKQHFGSLGRQGVVFGVVDALYDRHLFDISQACDGLPLITGGSALALGLADNYRAAGWLDNNVKPPSLSGCNAPVAIFSGSCSAASQEQVERARARIPFIHLDLEQLDDEDVVVSQTVARAMQGVERGAVLISSTAAPEAVAKVQDRFGATESGARLERLHGAIARGLFEKGVRVFIVGGGETSGAVADALNLRRLRVGPQIAPGVPWMTDADDSGVNIAFKSGNFGAPDFFRDAINVLKAREVAA